MAEDDMQLYKKLSDSVVEMEEDETIALSEEAVEKGYDAYEAIEAGLSDGMERAGKLFEEEEYFIPELLMCSDAMYAGLNILEPHIKIENQKAKQKVVIGVIEGDTHDIGKNLVKTMLSASGFDVFDLGRDVPPQTYVDKAEEIGADVIAISTLMTTTMPGMETVIKILVERGLRSKYKVIIGGGPISQAYADKIGADGYSVNAADAVRLLRRLFEAAA
jgi:corrinoid protein of di/trimethylamine methyltransferase